MATRRPAQHQHQEPGASGWGGNIFSNFMDTMQQGMQQHSRGAVPPPAAGASSEAMRQHAAALEEQRRREQEQERRQRGPPPASRMALKNIPEVKIAALDLAEETNRSCSVCLDEHELGEKVVKLPCAHIFHRQCVWEWLELHCTCPVCRFELETEDASYERERRVRMQGRRPRYRRTELDGLSIPQIRNLARGQNVNIAGCLEKADIVRCLIDSGTIEVVESETPTYSSEDLSNMGLRQLRSLMLQAGIGVEGCLEKQDLLERVRSSRLVTITETEPPRPPPPPPEAPFARYGGGVGGGGGGGGGGGSSTLPQGTPVGTGAPATEGRGGRGGGGAAPAPAGGGGEREEESASGSARRTSRTAGWWWGASRRDGNRTRSGSGSGGGGGSQAETAAAAAATAQPPPPPPPPQAASAAPTPAVRPLESMSVKELREITSRLGVSTAGCLEKRDMVERIRGCGRYREGAGAGRA